MTRTWKAIARTVLAGGLIGAAALVGPVPGAAAQTAPLQPLRTADASTSALDLLPAGTSDRMTAQVPLIDAASIVRTAIETGNSTGYAGIGLVDDHVTLWWKGQLPARVATAVESARRTAPVEVAAATYSQVELKAAAARLDPVVRANPKDAAHGVKLRTDGSGLEIAVTGTPNATLPKLPATGVRTTVVTRQPMVPRSREDDAAPWNGGARIWASYGCTSGFGVRDAGSGANYLLTAGHCSEVGEEWRDGAGTPIGPATHKNQDHDTMLISTPTAGGDVYTGGSHDEVRVRVTGWTEVFPGQFLCQSGSTTAGEIARPVCNFRVDFHYEDREDLVEATQLDGEEAARSGDSGGPVYAVKPDGTVLAAGTVTRSGGAGLGFQDFATARDDFGDIVPVTGTASATCRVSYVVTDSWSGGFAASVTVQNSGPAVSGWSLGWSFPGGQVIQGHWHGQFQQTGAKVTVTNEAHNAMIPAGGSVNLGFTASGSPATPTPFTLNGAACS
ncbi:cellulose binding domain-containing protein [Plantactinospora solaniradicis]|uniref:Cellulose binding domain-containing protein n=1 Tax=Plantactinospora solaniradicis TaxID=1723736 RepID=A0ABW1K5H2_9ACTN